MEFPERFNMAWYFLDRNVEEGRGDKTCLSGATRAYTYREVQARANRFGNVLRGLGVDVEDRVLLVLPDRPEFAFAWFGAAKIGAVIAMVNPILPAEDSVHYFEYTRAKVAVVDERARPARRRCATPSAICASSSSSATPAPHLSFEEGTRGPVGPARPTRTRTATTPPSGSSRAARRASRRRPSICSRTCRGTPSATRNR